MPSANQTTSQSFLAPHIWLNNAWANNVLLTVGANGCWQSIDKHPSEVAMQAAQPLAGTVLPSLVNAHSHAFQRAFAGMAETRTGEHDHFWSWRERMYGVANQITPAQLQGIAAQLYLELLQGGYTQVCEFHYLHHAPDGTPYPNDDMAWALVNAAQQVGIGLTLLPVLYERAGFSSAPLRADQRRFASNSAFVLQQFKHFNDARIPHVNAGVAIHSLRAACSESIHQLKRGLEGEGAPIHIHVSEQMAEVDDCVKTTGMRPVEWLAAQDLLDSRWHLVHATHTTAQEIEAVAKVSASVVICPTTEANLGDGFTDVVHWLNSGVGLSIGSDSHVSRTWREELRWLEYGQRLKLQQRNVLAAPHLGQPSTAQCLFQAAHYGGASAAGFKITGFKVGARADFLILDNTTPALLGVLPQHTLDALVFAADTAGIAQVYVAGQAKVLAGRHTQCEIIAQQYVQALHAC